jgi:hypothetical protein
LLQEKVVVVVANTRWPATAAVEITGIGLLVAVRQKDFFDAQVEYVGELDFRRTHRYFLAARSRPTPSDTV